MAKARSWRGLKPRHLVAAVIALCATIAAVWFVALPLVIDWATGEGTMVIEVADRDGPALVLDEASTRQSIPRLAQLLDQAAEHGKAHTERSQDIRAISEYLDATARASDGTYFNAPPYHSHVMWRGERYYVAINVS